MISANGKETQTYGVGSVGGATPSERYGVGVQNSAVYRLDFKRNPPVLLRTIRT